MWHKLATKTLLEIKYPGFNKQIRDLKNNHFRSLNELEAEQTVGLRQMLDYAFANVPYYVELSKKTGLSSTDIKTQKDMVKLPIITKKDIKKDPQAFISQKYSPHISSKTGGSTGEPFVYYIDKEASRFVLLMSYRAHQTGSGYDFGNKIFIFGGGSIYNKKNRKTQLIQKVQNYRAFSSYGIDEHGFERLYKAIVTEKPMFFYGYASSWTLFAEYLVNTGKKLSYTPKALFSTAEVLLSQQRELIEKAMNLKVFDQYGMYDGGVSAYECEAHTGMHIDFEGALLHVVDDNGNILKEGTGRVLATSLRNFYMPFINYDTGDYATITYQPCTCGRTTPRLMKVDGRTTDYLLIDGVYIGSPVLTILMSGFDVASYRIIQEDEHLVVFHLVVSEEIWNNSTKKEEMANRIKYSFNLKAPSANVQVVFHQTMVDLGIENKHKLIVNKTKK